MRTFAPSACPVAVETDDPDPRVLRRRSVALRPQGREYLK
jgi:hypothetical protein